MKEMLIVLIILTMNLALFLPRGFAFDEQRLVEKMTRYGKYDENLFLLTVASPSERVSKLGRASSCRKRSIVVDLADTIVATSDPATLQEALPEIFGQLEKGTWLDELAYELANELEGRGFESPVLRVRGSRSFREVDFDEELANARQKLEGGLLDELLYAEEGDYQFAENLPSVKKSSFQSQKLKILKRGEVAMTFDDGPHLGGRTTAILDSLKSNGFKATFFQLGSSISSNSTCQHIMQRIAAEGHDVGVHGWYHATKSGDPFTAMSSSAVRSDLTRACEVLTAGYGFAPCTFRAPYGEFRNSDFDILSSLGLTYVGWDIDTNDWRKKSPSQLAAETIQQIEQRGKGIVLMHDIQQRTAQAIPTILSSLRSQGYRLVTIREKLGLGGGATATNPEPEVAERFEGSNVGLVQVADYLNVRSGPSTEHAVIGRLQPGAAVEVLGIADGWYKIAFAGGGGSGFVSAKFINRIPTTLGRVDDPEGLNVRGGPSTSFDKVGVLAHGTTVRIIGTFDGWYRILFRGASEAYVSVNYIDAIGGGACAPATTKKYSGGGLGSIDAAAINRANPKLHSWAVMDVASGDWFGHRARVRPRSVASTIKLAVVNAVLHEIQRGAIKASETLTVRGPNDKSHDGEPVGQKYTVQNAIYHTLKRSSNTCPNLLAIRLGGLRGTNALLKKLGYDNTTYNYLSAVNRTESARAGSTARNMAMVARDFYNTYRHVLGTGSKSPWYAFSHAKDLIKAQGHETLGGKIGSNSLSATNTGLFRVKGRVYAIVVFSEENGLANNYHADTYLNKGSTSLANEIARVAQGGGGGSPGSGNSPGASVGVIEVADYLNVRKGPSTEHQILARLQPGTGVSIIARQNGWCQIDLGDGSGWVSGKFVREIPAVKGTIIDREGLNVRSGPSTSEPVLGVLPYGTKVHVIGETPNGWLRVVYGAELWAFVSSNFVRCEGGGC